MKLITDVLCNSEFISSLYGEKLSFDDIDLQEIKFGWNGPIVNFLFYLRDFPATPPKKWEKFNTILIDLSIYPLDSVSLTKFSRGNKCNLTIITPKNGSLIVKLTGESEASFQAKFISIDKVSAHLRI